MTQMRAGRRYAEGSVPAVDVAVWTAAIVSSPDLIALLSAEERAHAERRRQSADRDRYVTAHAMLRSLLAVRTGMAARDVPIARAPCHRCGELHGKPYLDGDPSVGFSLSHSGALAVVAIGSDSEVGVDVEYLGKNRDIARLAARTLSAGERNAFDASAASPDSFLRLWTRKEALLKATGAGISHRLSDVSVPPAATTIAFEGRTWTLVDLDLPSSYVGTLAVEGTGGDVGVASWEGPRP